MMERRRIHIQGVVQGVGFRPFVYRLAHEAGLSGFVLNDSSGVVVEVEGDSGRLDYFAKALQSNTPPLALIQRICSEVITPQDRETSFNIVDSQAKAGQNTLIPPDIATCTDCLQELFNPKNRRYRYPFINCTNCGPRFTIVRDIPYDRPLTTMADFVMCDACRAEYESPENRRFHAQPNACPDCGPQLQLFKNGSVEASRDDALQKAQALLTEGAILAVKGLGGYHLACDATNANAVQRLRQRKHRYDKPFALMARDMRVIETICYVNDAERDLLQSHRRPIVLLKRKIDTLVAPDVAPNQKSFGMMLPYTPLHHLLLDGDCKLLIMTSANLSSEPIAYRDADALERLANIADAFLTHNRPIHIRCDDSVLRVIRDKPQMLRRARGYAPQPLSLNLKFNEPVLAVGAHLKNTFSLAKNNQAFISQHIGDLDNLETLTSFREGIAHFKRLFDIEPEIIAYDMHPAYLSTQEAFALEAKQHIPIQHHQAHIASVMVEHRLREPVIGVAFDGTGYGTDGTIWGGEFLIADLSDFERIAHLPTVAMPGAEKAIHEPYRMAIAWLYQLYGKNWQEKVPVFAPKTDSQWKILQQMIDRNINCPLTSSAGRLFDAVAALLGVRHTGNYEGQAAIELEALADENETGFYDVTIEEMTINLKPMFDDIIADINGGISVATISARFHHSLAYVIMRVCQQIRDKTGLKQVALSGGVFQNVLLVNTAIEKLEQLNFEVYTNEAIPPNDGGIALGQAVIASTKAKKR